MAKRETISDTSLSEVDSLRTDVQEKFKSLHIALDERECDLMFRLDEIRGTIVTALKQWNGRIEDVKHTVSHASNEIRDNTWGFKLLKEAREELSILEKAKPNFKVDFMLSEGIEWSIANLGIIYIKQTNKQANFETELETNSPENSLIGEFPILQDSYENRFDLIQETFGGKIEFGTNIPMVPIRRVEKINFVGNKSKLVRSISCAELMELKPNLNPQYTARAFDDSCISNRAVDLQPNLNKTEFVKPKEGGIEMRKRTKSKRDTPTHSKLSDKLGFFSRSFSRNRAKTVNLTTHRLSELKIHKYLTKRVAVTSRWDKNKRVYGTLKCVVSRNAKIPIVGIQLDSNDGNSNGYYGGIQYFKTASHMSYFLPADEVLIAT